MMDRTEKIETKIIHTGRDPESFGGSVNPPVYHFSTVLYKSVDELVSRYDNITPDFRVMTYGTKGSPTSFSLEDAVAELEGGFRSISFPSGLAAVAGALFAFLKSGDHLLMTDSVYYPTREFCASVLRRFGVETTYYPPCIGSEIEELIQENTSVIYTESPGSHTFEVQDIPALSAVAHRHQAKFNHGQHLGFPDFFQSICPWCGCVDSSRHQIHQWSFRHHAGNGHHHPRRLGTTPQLHLAFGTMLWS